MGLFYKEHTQTGRAEAPHKIYRRWVQRRLDPDRPAPERKKGEPIGSPFFMSVLEKCLLSFRRDDVLIRFLGLLFALGFWRGHTDLAFLVDIQLDHVTGFESSG